MYLGHPKAERAGSALIDLRASFHDNDGSRHSANNEPHRCVFNHVWSKKHQLCGLDDKIHQTVLISRMNSLPALILVWDLLTRLFL